MRDTERRISFFTWEMNAGEAWLDWLFVTTQQSSPCCPASGPWHGERSPLPAGTLTPPLCCHCHAELHTQKPPDILYEICPCQWLVATKLSHSNRKVCTGRTPLVGRRGNPHWNALIKQSKGRVNCEKELSLWLNLMVALILCGESGPAGGGAKVPPFATPPSFFGGQS